MPQEDYQEEVKSFPYRDNRNRHIFCNAEILWFKHKHTLCDIDNMLSWYPFIEAPTHRICVSRLHSPYQYICATARQRLWNREYGRVLRVYLRSADCRDGLEMVGKAT